MPLSEFDLIATHFAPMAAPGALSLLDDAAFLAPPAGHDLVLTKDMLVAGVHFFADDPPGMIAKKALRVNLSDLAAKGAEPLGFLLGLALPKDITDAWLAGFAYGLAEDAAAHAIPLQGGDTVRSSGPLMISVTAIGSVPAGRMVRRLAVQPGDALYVSGTIGNSAIGLQLRSQAEAEWARSLAEASRSWLLERYLLPEPRMVLAPAVQHFAHAAMDISDGFVGDLTKMLTGSGCGAEIGLAGIPLSAQVQEALRFNPALMETALTGGDDYELLVAVPPHHVAAFETAAHGAAITRIGTATDSAQGIQFLGPDRKPHRFSKGSFVHF
jgi:thiamine-monophosphate kinase